MRKLWLIFAQATTVALAVLLVVSTLRPDLLPRRQPAGDVVTITQASAKPHPAEPDSAAGTYSVAARKAMPSVVNISTSKEIKVPRHPLMDDPLFRRFFGEQLDSETQRASSLGVGVIVGTEGYVLTNNHVIEQADEIEVLAGNDGRQARARIVGTDPDTDLAVLKVELENLPAITFGTEDHVNVGDVVLAIGNPFGVGQTVTMGIVPALELGAPPTSASTPSRNFIQTDAAINPGNSGGALVDSAGNLIVSIRRSSLAAAVPWVSGSRSRRAWRGQVMQQIIPDRGGDAWGWIVGQGGRTTCPPEMAGLLQAG